MQSLSLLKIVLSFSIIKNLQKKNTKIKFISEMLTRRQKLSPQTSLVIEESHSCRCLKALFCSRFLLCYFPPFLDAEKWQLWFIGLLIGKFFTFCTLHLLHTTTAQHVVWNSHWNCILIYEWLYLLIKSLCKDHVLLALIQAKRTRSLHNDFTKTMCWDARGISQISLFLIPWYQTYL